MSKHIRLFGIFGHPLLHTLSPAMHNAALRELGIPGIYLVFDRDKKRFLKLMRFRKKLLLDGFNITVPHKELACKAVDELTKTAKLIGAVNTVKKFGNRLMGYNTDGDGFLRSLREVRWNPKGKHAIILGAGGASRAVLATLAGADVRSVVVWNRTRKRAKNLVSEFRKKFPRVRMDYLDSKKAFQDAISHTDIVINATSLGLKPNDPLPMPKDLWPAKKTFFYDLIYRPQMTVFLKKARSLGHRTMNGEAMLLYQGVRAFEIWTNQKAPVNVMRKALRDALMVR